MDKCWKEQKICKRKHPRLGTFLLSTDLMLTLILICIKTQPICNTYCSVTSGLHEIILLTPKYLLTCTTVLSHAPLGFLPPEMMLPCIFQIDPSTLRRSMRSMTENFYAAIYGYDEVRTYKWAKLDKTNKSSSELSPHLL